MAKLLRRLLRLGAAGLLLSLHALLQAQPAAPPQAPIAQQNQPDYVIGPGDLLRISVFQNPDLTLETRVSESGTISYPLLGQLKLGGLSVAQAESAITRGLRQGQFVRQPQVTVLVTQVRGHQVSVLGNVNKPGRFPIEVTGMRLSEVLALAGGISPSGGEVVTVSGSRDGKPFRTEVDLPALYGARPRGQDPVLMSGDVVYVDRAPMVYIYGEVQKPGPIRLERDMNVMQALAAGGGVTLRGTQRGLKLHRRDADGKLVVTEPSMSDRLRDGDVVYVRESLF